MTIDLSLFWINSKSASDVLRPKARQVRQSRWFLLNFVISSLGDFTLAPGFESFLFSSLVFLSNLRFYFNSFHNLICSSSVSFVLDLFSSAILKFFIIVPSTSLPSMNFSSLSSSWQTHLLISSTSFPSSNMGSWTCRFRSWIFLSLVLKKIAIIVFFQLVSLEYSS